MKQIKKILDLNKDCGKVVVFNNRFYCEFTGKFTQPKRDSNAKCREISTANVTVYDYVINKKTKGYLMYAYDSDIKLETMMIYVCNDKKEIVYSANIVDYKIFNKAPKFRDLLKLIDFRPVNAVKEPIDSMDLSVARFYKKSNPDLEASIQCSILGGIYFETLNWTDSHTENRTLFLNQNKRDDIFTVVLSANNIAKIANRINKCLHKLFD